jgi:hypothetical protein
MICGIRNLEDVLSRKEHLWEGNLAHNYVCERTWNIPIEQIDKALKELKSD